MSIENALELNTILQQVEKYSCFSLGKKLIQNTKPTYESLLIQQENERIKEALACTVQYGSLPIQGFHDIREILDNALKGRMLSSFDLLKEYQVILGIKAILSYEKSCSDIAHPALNDLYSTLIVHTKVETMLNHCLNEYGEIKDNATPALKTIRAQLRNIDAEITSVATHFLKSHKDTCVDGIITNRNGRCVVLVKASDKNTFGGFVYGDSQSGNTSYIEPPALISINNRKQELVSSEQEEIAKILKECSKAVSSVAEEEKANIETVAILDCIFAKASWGKDRDATAASLTKEKEISITDARHPLIDPLKVVSNSYHLTKEKKILLITGPNTGGKTVSMKIIGLFTLMTYCGMPIPCKEAVIPFFDRVFVDIGDEQSVESSLSSFSSHMKKQAEVCQYATKDSLVLLDEAGSGTDPREGEALAISILNELRHLGTMAVLTTHYDRLKAYGKRHADIMIASVQFDTNTLSPTYRYLEGMSGQSNAFEIAERYGLPKSIVKYARYLKNQAKTKEDELIEQLEKELNEATLKQDALNKQLAEIEKLKKQLTKEKDALEKQKENLQTKAKKEADAYVATVQNKANRILKDIRKRQEQVKYHEALQAVQELNSFYDTPQEEEEEKQYVFHVGDAVELKGNSQVCEIISIKKKDITILMNGREVRVKPNQIRPSIHVLPKMKKQDNVSINTGRSLFTTMPLEVNLIGLHVDEAMEKLDSYMDQASLNGLKSFRIIHGDGTGRLRKAVHERLKRDSGVKEFRLGMPQEGGTGATIVTMK